MAAFGNARPHPFDQHVGPVREREHDLEFSGVLEIGGDRAAVPEQEVVPDGGFRWPGPLDPDHVGTQVGEDHRRVRTGPDAGQLKYSQAAQRTTGN